MTDTTPTERLVIDIPEDLIGTADGALYAHSLIITTARDLVARGERPWFQVWYPGTTEEDFDAVEVDVKTGIVTTLPSYVQLTMTKEVVSLSDIVA